MNSLSIVSVEFAPTGKLDRDKRRLLLRLPLGTG